MDKQPNKIVLVTGGSRGIGSSIARILAGDGYHVVLTYNNSKELAENIVTSIKSNGGQAMALQMSMENKGSIERALDIINDQWDAVNILINNAGVAQEKPFFNISSHDFDHMIAVNLKGPFTLCQKLIPDMIRQGWGRIVNISSIGGQWGGFNQVHYAAAKAGLINLTRSLARIYSKDGITVNAVAPGLIHTEMIGHEINSEPGKEKVRNIPVGRIGETKEVADVVKFLVSDEAGYITGQTINVNGGMYFI
jgi:acetoacetyl-CoA reductase/3-oxoacyl-[acyl-carrier protein] reductase